MTDLFLHIGMPKTGSTALQHFLSGNEANLEKLGISYKEYKGYDKSHDFIVPVVHRHDWDSVKIFLNDVTRNSGDICIISCGKLFAFSTIKAMKQLNPDVISNFEENEQLAISGFVKELKLFFNNIRVIAYLRRQDKALEASYNQSVKNASWKGGDILEFKKYLHNRLVYDGIADIWSNAVGKENLILKIYDRNKLKSNDIRRDFIETFGIDENHLDFDLPTDTRSENLRLSRDIFEYRTVINRIKMPKWRERQFKRALQAVDKKIGRDVTKWQSFLTISQRKMLMTEYETANMRLAKEYLGVNENPFGIEDFSELSVGDDYSGLTVENAIEIYLRLTREMNKSAYKIEACKYGLKGLIFKILSFLRNIKR